MFDAKKWLKRGNHETFSVALDVRFFNDEYCVFACEKLMKYYKNIYVSRGKELGGFRAILNTYIEIEAHYTKQLDNDDFGFVYGERACVATFSAAAIQNGWAALCEHEHQKISKYDGRKNSWGR